jgi:hypothetical protein
MRSPWITHSLLLESSREAAWRGDDPPAAIMTAATTGIPQSVNMVVLWVTYSSGSTPCLSVAAARVGGRQ